MKKLVTSLATLAVCVALAPVASATVLMQEGFNYADGGLVANSGGNWVNHSGTGTDITVTSGRAIGDNASAPDDNRSFAAQPTTSSTYACFDIIIPDPGAAPKLNYIAHFKDTGTTNFLSRVYVAPLAAGGWTFGLSHTSTSATVGPVLWSASSLTFGQKYNIVIKYDPVNATSTLWVDPVNESSTSISQTVAGTGVALSAFALRESSSSPTVPAGTTLGTANIKYSVDNLGVGTTFTDACVQYQATPTQGATWGKIKTLYR